MKVKFKFSNGQKVRDRVTGIVGIITGACIWLNGCIQYSIQPSAKEGDSLKPESWWMDEQQLELIDEGVNIKMKDTGGPSIKSCGPTMRSPH
jgi:hypothetical protein